MAKTELVVYRDESYPSAWLEDRLGHPDRIASFLGKKGLVLKNASELRQFMKDGIKSNRCYDKLVVFSQDIVPDTIVENKTVGVTIREFLDSGGSILWMGDIPLFYLGKNQKQHHEVLTPLERRNNARHKRYLIFKTPPQVRPGQSGA